MRFRPNFVLLVAMLILAVPAVRAQAPAVSADERAAFHRDPEWLTIAPHLPNAKTATAAQLELAGDVLRARRYPEDALDYYGYAIARGGNVSLLLNKMGVVRLDLKQNDLAHEMFQRTVRAQKKNAQGWNNLGVTEYSIANYSAAINDYAKAMKLDRKSAVYHSNLGMAYFSKGDAESARVQFTQALALDPHIFEHADGGGSTVHVVGTQNFAGFALEMARVYARRGESAAAVHWIAKATEAGAETKFELASDPVLRPYARDPRVMEMLKSMQQLRGRSVATALPAGAALGAPNPTNEQRID